MTVKEITNKIKHILEELSYPSAVAYLTLNDKKWLKAAIKALEQEPCEDAISRQAVLDGLASIAKARAKSDAQKSLMGRVMFFTEHLPPVTPQPKTGHWRHYEGMLTCSECGAEYYDEIMEYCGDDVPKCCPDCGARMESEG